jgi:hypothetical protein
MCPQGGRRATPVPPSISNGPNVNDSGQALSTVGEDAQHIDLRYLRLRIRKVDLQYPNEAANHLRCAHEP